MNKRSKKYTGITGLEGRKHRRAIYAEQRKQRRKITRALRKQFGLAKQKAHYNTDVVKYIRKTVTEE